ncbi:ABC transporter substrate-binding protein [Halopseudomonas laoshanensis]|nr:ABC transporter substrate-binding protein [Halopseudomonas laoshanensis]
MSRLLVTARRTARWLALTVLCSALPLQAATLEDLAGRMVTVPDRVERIVLGEGRLLPALAILEGDQLLERIVGMPEDFQQVDPGSYRQYLAAFPALGEVQRIGQGAADTFSLEQVLSLKPDLAIFSLSGHGPSSRHGRLIEQLERAGVAVIFVDFREQPLRNTPPSMALLGKVLGREPQAQAFITYYQQQLALVSERLAKVQQQPRVFVHSRAGLSDACCETMARGMMAALLEQAGGENVGSDRLPGAAGMLSLEYLLTDPPDVYVATAIGSADSLAQGADYIALGPGVQADAARASLTALTQRSGLSNMAPIRAGRAHAIWHSFYNSPFNVAAVQVLAQWLHPELYADLQPEQTLAHLYQQFQPVALEGTFWISQ